MKSFNCRALLLVLPTLAAMPATAQAGDLGATSRGTVSISITIPPRVQVAAAVAPDARPDSPLCVSSTGLGRYRIQMIQSGNNVGAGRPNDILIGSARSAASCGAAAHAIAGPARPDMSNPLTLLIVPD